jgi:hypothetical protein
MNRQNVPSIRSDFNMAADGVLRSVTVYAPRTVETEHLDQFVVMTAIVNEMRRIIIRHVDLPFAQLNSVRGFLLTENRDGGYDHGAATRDLMFSDLTTFKFYQVFEGITAAESNPDIEVWDVQWTYYIDVRTIIAGASNETEIDSRGLFKASIKTINSNCTGRAYNCGLIAFLLELTRKGIFGNEVKKTWLKSKKGMNRIYAGNILFINNRFTSKTG